MDRRAGTAAFRELHRLEPRRAFVLPNAWDAMSARAMEEAGAVAIGTTSAGIAWSMGFPDGQAISRQAMMAAVRRIVAAVKIPVTADVESGYGTGTPADVATAVREAIAAGVVGINLEDSPGEGDETLLSVARQAERIRMARAAADAEGVDLFINARTDTYLFQAGEASDRLDVTIARCRAYLDAGADGVFVPGVIQPALIGELAQSINAPLNVTVVAGAPSVPALGTLGVRRVSLGGRIAQVLIHRIRAVTETILSEGGFDVLREAVSFEEANGLFLQ